MDQFTAEDALSKLLSPIDEQTRAKDSMTES